MKNLIRLLAVTLTLWAPGFLLSQTPADFSSLVGVFKKPNGQPQPGLRVTFSRNTLNGVLINLGPVSYHTNNDGKLFTADGDTIKFYRLSTLYVECNVAGYNVPGGVQIQIPDSATFDLASLQPPTPFTGSHFHIFSKIKTITGTYPIADAQNDSLTLVSTDNSIGIAGTASTDRVDFTIPVLSITDAKIASAAGIALSKLATGSTGQILVGDGTGILTYRTLAGDATITSLGVLSVVDDSHNHTTSTISGLDASNDFTSGFLPLARGGLGQSISSLNNGRLIVSSSGAIGERSALASNALVVGDATSGVTVLPLGTANYIVGMNSGGSANEYKQFLGTSNQVTLTPGASSLTFSLPQSIATSSLVQFKRALLDTLRFSDNGGIIANDDTLYFYDNSGVFQFKLALDNPPTAGFVLKAGAGRVVTFQADATGGGGGGGTSFRVRDDGSLISSALQSIDFRGGLQAVAAAADSINIFVIGSDGIKADTDTLRILLASNSGLYTKAGSGALDSLMIYLNGSTLEKTATGLRIAASGVSSNELASITSAQLAGKITNETGSGLAVFGTSPTITTPTISGAIAFPSGVRQTFAPDATLAGLNWGSLAADPSSPANGDVWYRTDTGKFRGRQNGSNVDFIGAATAAWSSLTAPTSAVSLVSNADAETVVFSMQSSFSSGSMVIIEQATGNPTGGILFDVNTADSDVIPLRFTAGGTTNGVQMSNVGVLSPIGFGGIDANTYKGNEEIADVDIIDNLKLQMISVADTAAANGFFSSNVIQFWVNDADTSIRAKAKTSSGNYVNIELGGGGTGGGSFDQGGNYTLTGQWNFISAEILGANALRLEGATDNNIYNIIATDDPTVASATFKLPDLGAGSTVYFATDATKLTDLDGLGLSISGTALTFDATELSAGAISGVKVGFSDPDNNFSTTTIDSAVAELDNVINGGLPNATNGKVDWSQLVNVPAGFADGADDTGGGGGGGSFRVRDDGNALSVAPASIDFRGGLQVTEPAADSLEVKILSGNGLVALTDSIKVLRKANRSGLAFVSDSMFVAALDSSHITNGGIATTDLANGVILNGKLANSSVDSNKVVASQITTTDIKDGNILTADLAAQAVTGAKIALAVIDSTHITNVAIASTDIANSAILNAKIANSAVDSNKVAVSMITTTDIKDGNVNTADLANSAVTGAKIAANTVDGTDIALGSDAQGDVMYYNGTDWARLGAGTSGQFLKTNGTGANPAWATVGAGGGTSDIDFIFAKLVSSQTTNISANDHIKWSRVISSSGTSVSLDTATTYSTTNNAASIGRFTVNETANFQIRSVLIAQFSASPDNHFDFTIYDATNGTTLGNAIYGSLISSEGGDNNYSVQAETIYIGQLTSGHKYEIRLVIPGDLLQIGNDNSFLSVIKLVASAAASSGDITSVVAGNGLKGGATSGDATLDVNPKLSGVGRLIVTSDSLLVHTDAIDSTRIIAGTVAGSDIATGAILNAKLAASAVDSAKIATGHVTTTDIKDAGINTGDLANSAVTNAKVAAGAVDSSKVTDGSIAATDLVNLSVLNGKIAASAVDSTKIKAGAVTTTDILDATINTGDIAASAVTGAKIAVNTITGDKIALGSDAQGDVMYYNGTDWARLGAGTSGHFLQTQGAGANPQWAASSGSGDITAVGPGFASGDAFSDGVVSTGTTMLVWEGTTADANELSIVSPSADPGADINITLPSATGTLATLAGTETLTGKTYDTQGTGNVFSDISEFDLGPEVWVRQSATLDSAYVGTNVKRFSFQFDAATDEIVRCSFRLPSYTATSTTFDLVIFWYSASQTSGSAVWGLAEANSAAAANFDPSLSAITYTQTTTSGSAGNINSTTITLSSPGWAAGDLVTLYLRRDADGTGGTDSMTGDAIMIGATGKITVSK